MKIVAKKPATVCIIQADAKQYRLPFFNMLSERLKREEILLEVVYSAPNSVDSKKNDSVDLPPHYGRKVQAYWLARNRVLFQPCVFRAVKADLVIVEQASKHLVNYLFLAFRNSGMLKVAYWGHGYNWQNTDITWMKPIKRFLSLKVDWWFAYTERVGKYLEERGFPRKRITVVQNSIDVALFRDKVNAVSESERAALRHQLGIPPSARVGLFCGSIYDLKKPEFLVESAVKIRNKISDFHLIVIGSGPDEEIIRGAASKFEWLHYCGPQFESNKIQYFSLADVFLCPGLVGLAILDAFAAGLPIFTTAVTTHSPEIEYLDCSTTGMITEVDSEKYADAVVACLTDEITLKQMKIAALNASVEYGVEPMVENFAQGILSCLDRSRI